MKKIIASPTKYIQGEGELNHLYEHTAFLGTKGAYGVVDPFILDTYSKEIEKSFAGKELPLVLNRFQGECSKNEINRIIEEVKAKNCDIIIGIGGGKTLDTAKAVAFYTSLPVVICPTIASTDAPCSALSVVYTDDGQFEEYLFLKQNPNVVLVDTSVVVKAPVRLLVAGIGDALATYFEARACVRSCADNFVGGKASKAAFALSEVCYDILLEDGYKAVVAAKENQMSKAVENIIEANTYLSGIGFESCGLAAAHAIHNGLTVLEETHHMAHGEKVAFGTLCQLVLENVEEEELFTVLDFCKSVGLPTTLKELGVKEITPEKIKAVADLACAEGETIHNMPFPVTVQDVCSAIIVADQLGREE